MEYYPGNHSSPPQTITTTNLGYNQRIVTDEYERFGTTMAKDCGTYWLCENLPEGNEFRIIMKDDAKAQVNAAPDLGGINRLRYPKRHKNLEGNQLFVAGDLLEFPIFPKTKLPWNGRISPGPVRAVYEKEKARNGYDVIYHDPTKPGNLDFSAARVVVS